MSANVDAGTDGVVAVRTSGEVPRSAQQWTLAETTRRIITAHTSNGGRRYELSYDSVTPGRGRVGIVGCDASGEVVTELRGDVLSVDIPLIVRLLTGATGTDGTHGGEPAPTGPRAPRRPPRTGELWSGEEESRLATLHYEGRDPADIAQQLGRSEKSIRWKLAGLGLALFPEDLVPAPRSVPAQPEAEKAYTVEEKRREHSNAYKRWTVEEEEDLLDRCAQGVSLRELAEEFGRNEGAIASRLLKLDAQGPAVAEAEEFGG
ncbi:helix-turn-helix domain-containing protein [Kitasatospora sp. NPDC057015]|uniref:helix-turn-helix domain-containing protein n=1 Tax=Kitasatospora sp. NPDC057015 TaxID=3346001 RepID=UPI00363CF772